MKKYRYDDIPQLLEVMQRLRFDAIDYAAGNVQLEDFKRSARACRFPGSYMTVTHLGAHGATAAGTKEVIYGVRECLGYEESLFDMRKALSVVKEPYRNFMVEYARATYGLLSDEVTRRNINQDVAYRIQVVVNHDRHRHPVLVNRRSILLCDGQSNPLPFQINLCTTSLLANDDELKAVIPSPEILYGMSGFFEKLLEKVRQEASPRILAKIREQLRGKSLLTPNQAEVAFHLRKGANSGEISRSLGKSIKTVSKYNGEILERMNLAFPLLRFSKASHAAEYLERTGLLEFLLPGKSLVPPSSIGQSN